MQELNIVEVEQVSGGNPVVIIAAGVVGGIIGNYIYDSLGGAAGINKQIRNLTNAFM